VVHFPARNTEINTKFANFTGHVKAHFHSRKISTDRKFSEKVIVKSWKFSTSKFFSDGKFVSANHILQNFLAAKCCKMRKIYFPHFTTFRVLVYFNMLFLVVMESVMQSSSCKVRKFCILLYCVRKLLPDSRVDES
jgi:hypothetical protein